MLKVVAMGIDIKFYECLMKQLVVGISGTLGFRAF